jgi:ribosomal protein L17
MPEGNEQTPLPGGFATVEDMYKALETTKADLTTHKTRGADLKALQDKLAEHEAAESKRKQSEMTELEKERARAAALEKSLAEKDAAILHANRQVLLERVLSKRLSKYDERVGGIARRLYESAAVGDYADEETLNALLDPVDKELEGISTTSVQSGVRSINSSVGSPGGKPDPKFAAAANEFLHLPYQEQVAAARRATKG